LSHRKLHSVLTIKNLGSINYELDWFDAQCTFSNGRCSLLKFLSGSRLIRLTGSVIFAAGLISISSLSLWVLRESFVPVADIFLVIETAIMLQLVGLEKKQALVTPMACARMTWQALRRRLHRGHSQALVSNYISQ